MGAWEDIPGRIGSEDLSTLELEASDAFVLTRIDGRTSTADLCNITGQGERKTLEALERLLAAGLVSITSVGGDRTSIKLRKKTSRSVGTAQKLDSFHGVAPDLARWLNAQGPLGLIPGQRTRGTGTNRFGGMSFDGQLLKQVDWLTVERKKEILFLQRYRDEIDHFEFLGIEPTVDKRAIRNAFSDFSRKFHPDTVFRKEIGPFRDYIEEIFRHGTRVYEWLSSDETVRSRYVEAINQRDETIRITHVDARASRADLERKKQKLEGADRRAKLQARLDKNASRRKMRTRDRAIQQRTAKAAEFFEEGKKRLETDSFAAAYNAFRLANQYDPGNEIYQTMLEQAGSKMRIVKAEQVWKRGYLQESLGNFEEAMASYLEACEIWPRHEYCSHIAELLLRFDENLHKAEDLGRKAVQAAPKNVSYRMLLGRIYDRSKLASKARAEFEKVLEFDPKHADAKRALKAL
jgi:tetratricopeptide (TPR) repeat protein